MNLDCARSANGALLQLAASNCAPWVVQETAEIVQRQEEGGRQHAAAGWAMGALV